MERRKMRLTSDIKLVAERLRDCWAVRPEGTVGTCGWVNGMPWTVAYVRSATPTQAINKVWDMFYE